MSQLFTRDYLLVLTANFLLYMGFYILMPILPFFLEEVFGVGKATAGSVLASYTVAALLVRPFSGYLLDSFARKPLYLLAYGVFTVCFCGYPVVPTVALFVLLRVVQGFAFGMVTVGGNTIVIDIMPSERRGEGVGYYGVANNIAMATGPMVGLFLHGNATYTFIFLVAMAFCVAGMVCATMIRTRPRQSVARPAISLDRFILLKGLPGGLALMLSSMPYGLTSSYVAMYGEEMGISVSGGLFFSIMAIGLIVTRTFAGRGVDRGHLVTIIKASFVLAAVTFGLLAMCSWVAETSSGCVTGVYLFAALMMGISFGCMFPAYNNFFVNLAPASERGTAVSTYLTSWDVGVGLGLFAGGWASEHLGFGVAYAIGALQCVLAVVYFCIYVAPRYEKDRVNRILLR